MWGAVNSTEAAGISLCALEIVALALHVRAATGVRRTAAARRPYRFTSAALALQGLLSDRRRGSAAALLLLGVACALGLAWFRGETSQALATWRLD